MTGSKRGRGGYKQAENVNDATQWILDRFKKQLGSERVRQILHELELVKRVPGYEYVNADPIEQDRFKEEWEKIQKQQDIQSGNKLLWTFDIATIREHPTKKTAWSNKGKRPKIKTTGQHRKIHLYGAIDFLSGETFLKTYTRINSKNICEFLDILHKKHPKKNILLIWDNHRSHTSKHTRNYLQNNASWLEVRYTPKYSPKLNPVEQLWRWLREKVTHNKFYKSFAYLKAKIYEFFSYVRKRPIEVKRRCKPNFH